MNDELLARLPRADQRYLAQLTAEVELAEDGGAILVIFKNWPIGNAYVPNTADVMLMVPPGYPDSALDMFWMHPFVNLAETGKAPTACEVTQQFAGITWQRWSRHLTVPWRVGIDNLRSFFSSVKAEIAKPR